MKLLRLGFALLIGFLCASLWVETEQASSQEMTGKQVVEQLKAVKAKIDKLEAEIERSAVQEQQGQAGTPQRDSRGVKGMEDRVRRIEEHLEKDMLAKWAERLTLSGLIEVETGYEDMDFADPAESDEKSRDISLATVELGFEVDVVSHVKGHVLLLYEDDEDVVADEGIIIIDGEDVLPLYLNAGKMYVPFGYYESHFISDPLTLQLGETRESAVEAGLATECLDLCVSAFNGDIDETGDHEQINSYVASLRAALPQETVTGLGFMAGVSYMTNIADSDSLQEVGTGVAAATITDCVAGFSAFLSVSFMDKVFVEAEYLGATDKFKVGELAFDGGKECEPKTWNVEVAYLFADGLEGAVKYEGGNDLGNFLPEKQYGAAVIYGLFENTFLAFEYLHGKFANDDERDLFTAQLGMEF
jgi:hypothetical protein